MDLKQRYTEETEALFYDMDEWFYTAINEFSMEESTEILRQMFSVLDNLPSKSGWSQTVSGVIKRPQPLFFKVEYLKQPSEIPLLLDVFVTSCDEHLDAIIENQSINFYLNKHINEYHRAAQRDGRNQENSLKRERV